MHLYSAVVIKKNYKGQFFYTFEKLFILNSILLSLKREKNHLVVFKLRHQTVRSSFFEFYLFTNKVMYIEVVYDKKCDKMLGS